MPKDPALVGDWSFTNQKDHLFPNALGKSLSAKIVGKAQVVDVSGSKAIQLDGKGFLEVGMDPQLNLQACTMEAWIRPGKQAAAGGRIIDKTGVGTSNGYLLDTHPGNSLRLIAERGSLSFDARLAPERWVHVAGTIAADGSQALYVDGKQVAFQKLSLSGDLAGLEERIARIRKFHDRLAAAGLADRPEAAQARLAAAYYNAFFARQALAKNGRIALLPEPSRGAADKSYLTTVNRLWEGLEKTVKANKDSSDPVGRRIYGCWPGP